jgi:hypothetical protein
VVRVPTMARDTMGKSQDGTAPVNISTFIFFRLSESWPIAQLYLLIIQILTRPQSSLHFKVKSKDVRSVFLLSRG